MIDGFMGMEDLCNKGFVKEKLLKTSNYRRAVLSKLGNKIAWSFQGNNASTNPFPNTNIMVTGKSGRNWSSLTDIGTPNQLTYKEAYALETKIDDGKPDTGVCRWNGLKFTADDGSRNTILSFKMDF